MSWLPCVLPVAAFAKPGNADVTVAGVIVMGVSREAVDVEAILVVRP